MAPRKLLFVLFTTDACTLSHALLYALDLTEHGHTVRLIIEGPATGAVVELDDGKGNFSNLLAKAKSQGLIRGACRTASGGCGQRSGGEPVTEALTARGIALLDDLHGHAGIADSIAEGFELVIFG